MSYFHDGPHGGKHLSLQRAPFLLRVVVDQAGNLDALDQLADTPRPGETITVYRRISDPMTVHIDGKDPKTGRRWGRWEQSANYRLAKVQPDDLEARDSARWRTWAQANARNA